MSRRKIGQKCIPPEDCLRLIFLFLDGVSLVKIQLTNRYFHNIVCSSLFLKLYTGNTFTFKEFFKLVLLRESNVINGEILRNISNITLEIKIKQTESYEVLTRFCKHIAGEGGYYGFNIKFYIGKGDNKLNCYDVNSKKGILNYYNDTRVKNVNMHLRKIWKQYFDQNLEFMDALSYLETKSIISEVSVLDHNDTDDESINGKILHLRICWELKHL